MNGTFSPLISTNEVYRDTDRTRCLTLDIEDLETGKANTDHIHPVSTDQLWSGALLMDSTQTVTPSKKLSECDHGWMLLWSDADVSTDGVVTANNFNFVHTPILKKSFTNSNWNGSNHMFSLPSYIKEDGSVTSISIKQLIFLIQKIRTLY